MCKPSVTLFRKLNEREHQDKICNIYAFQKGLSVNRRFDDDASVIKQMMHGLDCLACSKLHTPCQESVESKLYKKPSP